MQPRLTQQRLRACELAFDMRVNLGSLGVERKTGNAHLRRIVVEAAWAYRHRPSCTGTLKERQKHLSEEVKEIAWKAQHRLHGRYARLLARGKNKQQAVTAVARELLGFIWSIGVQVERSQRSGQQRAA